MINRGERFKTPNEVENIIKNPQSFLEVISVQNEVLLSHKPQNHSYE